ncbi:hypothetical protein [Sulfitobacter aestuariivivens]|uniref:Uncharacterized protein n=1 Tax=Sulfitobacter aestuariivivens TaxID=2766981 RepID=A0A927HE97_9RHOB|nr:hypothetical protein [Sulfitobacter aestuariivivens]MBD3663129.1 hypothetical protein [Sulfitobacter aestuariivivens]
MKTAKCAAVASVILAGAATAVSAQGFDPRANCGDVLQSATEVEQTMIAAWTFGYIAANTANVRPVDGSNNAVVLQNIFKVCQANPTASLLDLVSASTSTAKAPAPADVTPGSEADARRLLTEFLDPNADHRALTQAILPTEAEISKVYSEPLASAMWASYSGQLGPDVAFAPKTGQTDLIVVYTTTRELFDRKPVLGKFPGGYKKVLQYFKLDVPIVRFKFVKPGETSGFAFDGLIYLDGRWVIMPKPWRAIPS